MKTEIINNVRYQLIPSEAGKSDCFGCHFDKSDFSCFIITKCCDHKKKYGKYHIYKEIPKSKPKIIWIIKSKRSGKDLDYCFTREEARTKVSIKFYGEPMRIVKGMLQEI